MSFFRGPDIVKNGLILYLDAANSKSFRGEPTTNVVANPLPNSGWNTSNFGGSSVTRTFLSENGNSYMRFSDVVNASDYPRIADSIFTSNITGTFSVSLEARGTPGAQVNLRIYESGSTKITNLITLTSDWVRYKFEGQSTGFNLNQPYFNPLTTGAIYDIRNIQIESKSHTTPFVNGTRGATVATGGGFKDLTRNANNYTLVGDVISQDNHLYFSGDQDYFQPDNNSSFNSLTNITLESWCYPMRSSSYEYLFSNARDCCGIYSGYELRINNGTPRFTIWNATTSGNTSVNNSSTVSLNNWYHIVATYSGTQLKIYVNGVLGGTTNSTLGIGTPSTYDLYVGRMGHNQIYEYQGYIDISKIYNRALSDGEVLKNYNATKSRFGL
jgi:hypothetical protein